MDRVYFSRLPGPDDWDDPARDFAVASFLFFDRIRQIAIEQKARRESLLFDDAGEDGTD